MNKLKFRLWSFDKDLSEDDGRMWDDEYLQFNFTAGEVCFGACNNVADFEDVIIMQWTGLFDKGRNEIYIGDILRWSDDAIIEIREKDELGFYYETVKSFDENVCMHDIRFYRSSEDAIVIGNILENPKMKNKSYWTKKKLNDVLRGTW